jgi:hypothetical protein
MALQVLALALHFSSLTPSPNTLALSLSLSLSFLLHLYHRISAHLWEQERKRHTYMCTYIHISSSNIIIQQLWTSFPSVDDVEVIMMVILEESFELCCKYSGDQLCILLLLPISLHWLSHTPISLCLCLCLCGFDTYPSLSFSVCL